MIPTGLGFRTGTCLWILIILSGCSSSQNQQDEKLFEQISSSSSGVAFSNVLSYSDSNNIYTNENFYSGGGVALGDINGDELPDIYFVGNQIENRLYLNKGGFQFEDITHSSGTGGTKGWSNGVSMVDINGDGLLDIYVSNGGGSDYENDRENELFINNGDETFSERAAEYGLNDSGNSIHASFFDYDNDGDLDMYLLNNFASKQIGSYDLSENQRGVRSFDGGDRLFRNDDGTFIDVTEEAGIYSSEIGFGLGVSVADLDRDGWMDMYISNDFFERDYLYMNNGDGTFREVLEETFSSISTTSMGGDIGDLNNDGFPEIFISDMLPRLESHLKTQADFISWSQFRSEVESGYHKKFPRNTLQYNNGDGTFSEIGRYAGVEATDWSWGALMADFNLNGSREIFIPNGFFKSVTDKDHYVRINREDFRREITTNNQLDYKKLVEATPSEAIPNYMFENQGELRFSDRTTEWGLDVPAFSTGSAYGDLDNDGDLELVVNNVNSEAQIFQNRSRELYPGRSWLKVELKGGSSNTFGVGAQLELNADGQYRYIEQIPQRGYLSSVDPVLHIGLGEEINVIDTLRVKWPDGQVHVVTGIETRQQIVVRQEDAVHNGMNSPVRAISSSEYEKNPLLRDVTGEIDLDWSHEESDFNDFEYSPMLFNMRSTEGPPICKGDINGDELEDVYAGGAAGRPGALFIQSASGEFVRTSQSVLESDRESEDTDCIFFDATGDSIPELYVASGSSEFFPGNPAMADRLYIIDQDGGLSRLEGALPRPQYGYQPTGVVRAADANGDGSLDLFTGVRLTSPGRGEEFGYGIPVGGYLLINDGNGKFEDATDRLAPQLRAEDLRSAGVTDAAWGDVDGNGFPDLILVGEWMPLTIFYNRTGHLEKGNPDETGFENTAGWWKSLVVEDLNGDGRLDLVAGNHGLNSRFQASTEKPVQMWVNDFDRNGFVEQILTRYNNGGPYPVILRQNLLQFLPHLNVQFPTFASYAGQTITDVFDQGQLESSIQYRAEEMGSVVGWSTGDGHFDLERLPFRVQLTPIYAILAVDLNDDGKKELLMGGNLDEVKPQVGSYDAGFGTVLEQDSSGSYREMSTHDSGFMNKGNIRSIQRVVRDGKTLIMVGRNDQTMNIFEKRF